METEVVGAGGVAESPLPKVAVRLTNRYDFTPLGSALCAGWALLADGVPLAAGPLPLPPIAPQASADVEIITSAALLASADGAALLARANASAGAERYLALSFVRCSDGHELAWAQLPLPPYAPAAPSIVPPLASSFASMPSGPLSVVRGGDGIIELSSGPIAVTLSGASGLPISIKYNGVERLDGPIEPSLWRPLTDNELGSGQTVRLRKWRTAGRASRGGYLRPLQPLEVDHKSGEGGGGDGGSGGGGGGGQVVVRGTAALTPDGSCVLRTECVLSASGTLGLKLTIMPCDSGGGEGGVGSGGVGGGGGASDAAGGGAEAEGAGAGGEAAGAPSLPALFDEASVCLRSGAPACAEGKFMDVQDDAVRCRWDDPGAWQQFVLRLAEGGNDLPIDMPDVGDAPAAAAPSSGGSVRPILYGHRVCLTSHNGRYVASCGGGRIEARRMRQGEFGARPPLPHELFVLESGTAEGEAAAAARRGQPVRKGEPIRLRAMRAGPLAAGEGGVGGAGGGDGGEGGAGSVGEGGNDAHGGGEDAEAPPAELSYLAPSILGGDYPTRVVDTEADPRVRLLGLGEGVWTILGGDEAPPTRIGLDVPLCRAHAEQVVWHGRGPYESYPDRKDGMRLGVWHGPVAAQAHPYVRPQETGAKHECRWMALADAPRRRGLLVCAAPDCPPAAMGCHHYDPDDLDALPESRLPRVRHAAALAEQPNRTQLSVDGAHAGVGGIDSWGSLPMPHHRLRVDLACTWAFAMRPFECGGAEPDDLAAMAAAMQREM